MARADWPKILISHQSILKRLVYVLVCIFTNSFVFRFFFSFPLVGLSLLFFLSLSISLTPFIQCCILDNIRQKYCFIFIVIIRYYYSYAIIIKRIYTCVHTWLCVCPYPCCHSLRYMLIRSFNRSVARARLNIRCGLNGI